MKNILCYGDSNTWGNIPGSMNKELMLASRYPRDSRWPGILQDLLGKDYNVIEAGLNGRNTAFDETRVIRPSRNGLATLPLILETHYPINLVIFMLGTNDVKKEYNASPEKISENMLNLIQTVKRSHFADDFKAPEIMLICPAPIRFIDVEPFNAFYDQESASKSKTLSEYYSRLAEDENCLYLDAAQFITVSDTDGIHFEPESHKKLAHGIFEKLGANNAIIK